MTYVDSRNLARLELKPEYRSDQDRTVADFYIPCLKQSKVYRRAVGYFTSEGLALAGKGLAVFLRGEGQMRLVASPVLSPADAAAITAGHAARTDALARALLRPLLPLEDAVAQHRLSVVAWLIAEERLEIRLALRQTPDGAYGRGIYHEKIGIFSDGLGNSVAFSGSSNETAGGLVSNFESFDVFVSWDDPAGRVQRKSDNFERLWTNNTDGVEVLGFPEVARRRLLEFRSGDRPSADPEERAPTKNLVLVDRLDGVPSFPRRLNLREYQRAAIAAWLQAKGRGLLKMATGTGKTITALSLLTTLWEGLPKPGRKLAVVIICPYRHLVTQWNQECVRFGFKPVLCFESKHRWMRDLDDEMLAFKQQDQGFLAIATTNSTFASPAFQERLEPLSDSLLVVADEVHNMGSSVLRAALPSEAPYRLGLSATPERWFDDTGTEALLEYFGDVAFEYGLAEAIQAGALTEYNYYPILVSLTPSEAEEYHELSREIARRYHAIDPDAPDGSGAKFLLLKRARLLASAHNKIGALRKAVAPLGDTTHNLFYCGDGRVEYSPDENDLRQLEAVLRVLGRELGMRVDSYTAETYLDERDRLREAFAGGDLQGLVAIRCLDEGVDIPATHRAFILASSTNPKQFVQRRGRVLRPAPGKRYAEIYDFIVVPPEEPEDAATFNIERRLVKKELERFVRFAALARNAGQARSVLLPLQERYNLLDM